MALNNSEIKEIEVVVRKEIKNFMNSNTVKQFEERMLEKIQQEIKKGKLENEIKDLTIKMFREFYNFMWTNKNQWEIKLKNA